MCDKSKCLNDDNGDLLLSRGLKRADIQESFMPITERRLREENAGQLELVNADTAVLQSNP